MPFRAIAGHRRVLLLLARAIANDTLPPGYSDIPFSTLVRSEQVVSMSGCGRYSESSGASRVRTSLVAAGNVS